MTHSSNTPNDPQSESDFWEFVFIQSPARLHFGLMEVCSGQDRLFGGLGAMIEQPATQLSLTMIPSKNEPRIETYLIDAEEPWRSRIESVVKRWMLANGSPIIPAFQIRLDNQPRMHAGLGSGTQVACATVSLLNHWYQSISNINKTSVEDSMILVDDLSQITQRGKRSFVGLAGHQQGGFIVDYGLPATGSQRQVVRLEIPHQWHVVLVKPLSTATISGVVENDYFGQSQFPNPHRESMWTRIQEEIIPALEAGNLKQFSSALYEYGRDAGRVFARVQGGIYRDQIVASLIDWMRAQGVAATGQTSWGPTVYAILGSKSNAEELLLKLSLRFPVGVDAMVTPFNHTGYCVHQGL
jgi:beta-RFAP synthase